MGGHEIDAKKYSSMENGAHQLMKNFNYRPLTFNMYSLTLK